MWCSVLVPTLYHCSTLELYIFLNCDSVKCFEASLKLRMITVSKIIINQCCNYFPDILIGYLCVCLFFIFRFLNTVKKENFLHCQRDYSGQYGLVNLYFLKRHVLWGPFKIGFCWLPLWNDIHVLCIPLKICSITLFYCAEQSEIGFPQPSPYKECPLLLITWRSRFQGPSAAGWLFFHSCYSSFVEDASW